MDLQGLRKDIHRKGRHYPFLLEAEAQADQLHVHAACRQLDPETGHAHFHGLAPDRTAMEKEDRETEENRGSSQAFRQRER